MSDLLSADQVLFALEVVVASRRAWYEAHEIPDALAAVISLRLVQHEIIVREWPQDLAAKAELIRARAGELAEQIAHRDIGYEHRGTELAVLHWLDKHGPRTFWLTPDGEG